MVQCGCARLTFPCADPGHPARAGASPAGADSQWGSRGPCWSAQQLSAHTQVLSIQQRQWHQRPPQPTQCQSQQLGILSMNELEIILGFTEFLQIFSSNSVGKFILEWISITEMDSPFIRRNPFPSVFLVSKLLFNDSLKMCNSDYNTMYTF